MNWLIEEEEAEKLIDMFFRSNGETHENDLFTLLKWAGKARTINHMVDMVLRGELTAIVEDGEVKLTIP